MYITAIAQISQCTISHNAPFCKRNVHMCAVNIYIYMLQNIWCIVGFVRSVYCVRFLWPNSPSVSYGGDGVPNHRRLDCLLSRFFRRRSKKTPRLPITGLCDENSLVTGEFPAQRASNAENIPFDDVKLNLLKLNDDKTELLVITSRPSTSESLHMSINVGDQYISPSEEPPKNLGVIFYSTCSLKDHVSNVCRSINFNLYSIGKIRKYLDRPTVEKLVNATMTSRLDYCNSLMFGISK